MKVFITTISIFLCVKAAFAQFSDQLSSKVSVRVSTNLETYFIAERLAVDHIDNFVFDSKGSDYKHEPIIYYGYNHFKPYLNKPVILGIAALIRQLRDIYHDNGPIMDYLVNQTEFPSRGILFKQISDDPDHPKVKGLLAELTDSLRKFYIQAGIGSYLKSNSRFYKGALKEVEKDIDISSFPAMETWYGNRFAQYRIYIVPGMPITAGDDNYRGYSPRINYKDSFIPAMVMSPDTMLTLQSSISAYNHFGFDNPKVTHLLTKHEMGHSFVNPSLAKYKLQIDRDSALYTPQLKKLLTPHYINDWYVTIIEHLVRLGEIRTAASMGELKEAERLRRVHIKEYGCILIPMLEIKIKEYESNRHRYPNYESFLPVLIAYFHSLTPELIDQQIKKYEKLF